MDAEATTLVTTVIWTLRICLPIILFLLYYRVPFPDLLPKKHRHTRATLLGLRPVQGAAPHEMASLGLIDQKSAPHLFVSRKRGKAADREAKPDEPAVVADKQLPAEAMLHLESLLNYMAFNRKSHRTFHPLHPPPPPSAAPPPSLGQPSADFQEKANLDAQMVLEGALMFKKLDVVPDVHDSLTNTKVTPAERTFALMVEVCIAAHDLPKASEFLMKMEQCQYTPDVKLLDRVMELYAQHKVTAELGQRLSAEKAVQDVGNGASGLSADAAEFVPTTHPEEAWDSNGGARWWPAWQEHPWDDPRGGKAKHGKGKEPRGKDTNGAGKGKGKGWPDKGWNTWQSDEYKGPDKGQAKGKKGKERRAEKNEKKGKGDASDMPDKSKKGGAVWRKREKDTTDPAAAEES